MILTSHALVGSALSNIVPNNPVIGFGLAFASHYLIDAVPHRDYDIEDFIDDETKTVKSIFHNAKAFLRFMLILGDFVFALFICSLIFVHDEKSLYATMVGVAGGVLPDFLLFLAFKFKKSFWRYFYKVHNFFHSKDRMRDKLVRGISSQILLPVLIILIYILIK